VLCSVLSTLQKALMIDVVPVFGQHSSTGRSGNITTLWLCLYRIYITHTPFRFNRTVSRLMFLPSVLHDGSAGTVRAKKLHLIRRYCNAK
jgi:hypothetical protein